MTKVKITSIASSGKGVGFVEKDGIKIPYFVAFTAPGDTVDVKNEKKVKRYVEADVDKLFVSSKLRNKKVCHQFGFCGGCNLLHVDYETQVREKTKILTHILDRNKITHPEIEVVKCKDPFNYRYRTKLFFTHQKGRMICGFKKRKSNIVVALRDCQIVHKRIEEFIAKFNSSRLKAKCEFEAFVVVDFESGKLSIATKGVVEKSISKYLEENADFFNEPVDFTYQVGAFTLHYDNKTFIQSNLEQNEELARIVQENVTGKTVFDLYAGIGNFGIPVSKSVETVYCVEHARGSLKSLEKNIASNSASNVKPVNQDVNAFLLETENSADTIILDPPRTGCEAALIKNSKAERIIYVSCNPLTLKDDLKTICLKYQIEKIYLVDMFPHTEHIESVTVLSRLAKSF